MIAPQPFFQPRGTPFSVLHRLRALARLGHEIDLLTYHLGEDVEIDGVTIHRIPKVPFVKKIAIGPSKRKVVLDIYLYAKAVRMLKNGQYDLIHSHEEAGFFTTHLAKRFDTLHLYDMHSSLPQQLSNFKFTQSRIIKAAFDKLEAATINNAAAVITICPELYNYVKSLYPDKYNILIENVADNSLVFESEPDTESIAQKIGRNGDKVVLYAGTFEPYQGIDLLIESSRRIVEKEQNVRFVLVGGKPEQIDQYRSLVEQMSLQDKFVFTGSVLPNEVPYFIESCDVLVSPRVEGNNTPLKIYSYLRSGKPIVATRHITHTQVLDENVSVLTDCTPEAFGDGVLSVIQDSSLCEKLSANAKRLAEKKYSYEVYLQKTKAIYDYIESQLNKGRSS